MSVRSMKKITILAARSDADAIINRLMRLRCVELTQAGRHEEGLLPTDLSALDRTREACERNLSDIRTAIPALAKYSTRRRGIGRVVLRYDKSAFVAEGRDARARRAVSETLAVLERRRELELTVTRTHEQMSALTPWLNYDAPMGNADTSRTAVLLGVFPSKTDREALDRAVDQVGAYAEWVLQDETGLYAALTVLREDRRSLETAVSAFGFAPISFPIPSTTARLSYDAAEDVLDRLSEEKYHLEERLRDLAECLDDIEILSDIEATTAELCRQKRKLAETDRCVVIEGWIPEVMLEALTDTLSRFVCACDVTDPDEDEDVPVLLQNNRFSTTFEWVIGMYSYPRYGTFDPTVIMSIFYFLIFGMMFADVGYGLLLSLCCFVGVKLLNPKPGMRRMLLMFGFCGISCMVMGVLFGGWFGNLPTAIMDSFIYREEGAAAKTALGSFFYNGLIFNPIDSSTAFLLLSLGMGQLHLMAGMVINMIETCRKGRVHEGICSTVPYWILFIGIDLMVPGLWINMFSANPEAVSEATLALFAMLSQIGKYTMFAGFASILLFKGAAQKSFVGWLLGGLGGLYSLISFASDLLSYSRILALGLVAGVIAQVINMMTGLGASGPVGFVFMLIVMLVGHGLNLAINLLGTFVHAARLQYIEFFGKFYEDGGTPFSPLCPVEDYSEELISVSNEKTI